MYASDGLRAYRRARTTFSAKVYGLLILWLFLALVQWIAVCLVEDARTIFKKFYYISLIAFALAVLLLTIFIFADGLRFMQFLNFILSLIIVELQIVATFLLVALSWWADVLVFFVVTAALVFLFLLIGIILPRRVDLTLDIAVLFIIAFIFLIIAVFALTLLKNLWFPKMYTYLTVELAVTLTILLFVIYHAQTIHGNRFAEMRLNDFFLGSLILFHDFLIIFWLTFYWQIRYRPITPNSWVASSVSPHKAFYDFPGDWAAIPHGTVFTDHTWDDGRGPEYSGTDEPGSNEDQDEDSSQHRRVTKKLHSATRGSVTRGTVSRASTSRGSSDRRNQKKPSSTTTPMDWAVFKSKTMAFLDNQDEPVQKIQKNLEPRSDYRSPGVLYKVSPIYGGEMPQLEDENTYTDKDGNSGHFKILQPESANGDAQGKLKVGFVKPSVYHTPPDSEWGDVVDRMNDGHGNRPKGVQVNPEKHDQENENLSFLGDENLELSRIAKPQPNWEFPRQDDLKNQSESKILRGEKNPPADPPNTTKTLHVEELKNLSDSKILRVNEKSIANPRAKLRPLPDFRKLLMNDTSNANLK